MLSKFHLEMPFDEYRSHPAMSNSSLSLLKRSPASFKHAIIDGNRRPSTKAQEIGTAVHAALLEPLVFEKTYTELPGELNLRTKVAKDYVEEIRQQGKIGLSPTDWDRVNGCRAAVEKHGDAKRLLGSCETEVSYFFKQQGVDCKARADALNLKGRYVLDLKTTGDVFKFENSVADYGYHRQAAWYLEGIFQVTGERWDTWYWLTVEPDRPNLLRVYQCDPKDLAEGRHENEQLLERYKKCLKMGEWPGPDDGKVVRGGLPSWYQRRPLADIVFKKLK